MSQPSRAPKFDLSDILAQPHPQIDLRLDAFEASTRKFLKALSNYHERAIVEITKRRERHAAEKKKLNEKASAAESETTQCKVREIELVAGESCHSYSRATVLSILRAGTGAGGEKGRGTRCCFIQTPAIRSSRKMRIGRCRD